MQYIAATIFIFFYIYIQSNFLCLVSFFNSGGWLGNSGFILVLEKLSRKSLKFENQVWKTRKMSTNPEKSLKICIFVDNIQQVLHRVLSMKSCKT